MTTAPHPTPSPCDCPRCGYDLSGAVARWSVSCDLRATCPECGLEFPWCDVMNPGRVVPGWFYEAPARSALGTLPRTIVRMLLPRRFWSRIGLAVPVHTRRLVALVLAVLLIAHCSIGGAGAFAVASEVQGLRVWAKSVTSSDFPGVYWRLLVWPYSRHTADVVFTYNSGPPTAPLMTSRAAIGARGFPGPHLLLPYLAVSLMPVSYLLLRQTLRKTRVRSAHLFRISAYSSLALLPILAPQILLSRGWRDTFFYSRRTTSPGFNEIFRLVEAIEELLPLDVLLLLPLLAFLGIWWGAATTRYLRLPHAAGVVLAMLTITSLVLAILYAFTYNPYT